MKRITLPLVLALTVVIGAFVLLNSTIKPIQDVVAKQNLMATEAVNLTGETRSLMAAHSQNLSQAEASLKGP